MDEMTRLRELRATVPLPDRGRLAPGRALLLAAAGTEQRRRTGRTRRRLVLVAVAAAVTAVAVTVSVLVGGHTGRKVEPAAPVDLRGLSAAQLLERAARVVAAEPGDTVPTAKQWIYTKSVQESEDARKDSATRKLYVSESWIRYDGSAMADRMPMQKQLQVTPMHLENGGEGDDRSPRELYRFVATLPADGDRTLAAIRAAHAIGDIKGETKTQRAYREISVLLGADVLPSKGLAGLYLALATLPGGSVTDHLVENAAGRRVIAVSYETSDPGPQGSDGRMWDQWLLDPQTYRVVGTRMVTGDTLATAKAVGGNSTITKAVVTKAGQTG
ncbi:hypothetical protein OK074_2419 [Actinobacteria bacterium OK074]|nr:hypothetical protein OK074_2419 [Actinobacteria bacterium OK074]